ncbi:efflux RND transporter periplasmic adaptor subunit [Roseivirga sp.]|uniref:efflux RND transporter periplasmic adaptor subunit n=1 Tax=Roseivirga sp. TaxID=1964215 RepID=UPI003B8AEE13
METEIPDTQSLKKDVEPTMVSIAQAQYRPFEFLINSSGTIASGNELSITFQASGVLKQLNIKNGQMVRKGQVIGQLENTQQQFAVEKAEASLEDAKVRYTDAMLSYGAGITELQKKNLLVQNGVPSAEINLKEAKMNMARTQILAPISGIIAELEEKQGNIISGGSKLAAIYEPKNLTLSAKILETDFKHIKLGQRADIYTLSFKDKIFEAYVSEINPKVDKNGMVELKLQLKETEGLLPGMNANAVIRVPQSDNIIVPRDALVIKSGRQVVFTFENGLAIWKYVKVGLDNGVDIEILEGLEEGDQVIVSDNLLQIGHEAKVAIGSDLNNN